MTTVGSEPCQPGLSLTDVRPSLKRLHQLITVASCEWMCNSCAVFLEFTTDLPLEKEEQLVELQSDQTFQVKHDELPPLKFWILAKKV